MATLKNHPGFWLRDDAAESLARWEADNGVIGINSAGRSVAEQNEAIARWRRGGAENRPPYLFQPADPAETSNHVKGGGVAIDTSEVSRFKASCGEYGWSHPYPQSDPVHFEYDPANDRKGGGGYPARARYGEAWTRAIQEKLIRMGHDLGPSGADGFDGPLTQAAVRHEQEAAEGNGYGTIARDGIAGPDTNAYLDWAIGRWFARPVAPAFPLPEGFYFGPASGPEQSVSGFYSHRDDLRRWQEQMKARGWQIEPDGLYGDGTGNVAEAFQREKGLAPDRLIGPDTWRAAWEAPVT